MGTHPPKLERPWLLGSKVFLCIYSVEAGEWVLGCDYKGKGREQIAESLIHPSEEGRLYPEALGNP